MSTKPAALLLVLASCASPSRLPFEDRPLASIPADSELVGIPAFSPDGRAVAYIARVGDRYRAVLGAWTSRRLDAI